MSARGATSEYGRYVRPNRVSPWSNRPPEALNAAYALKAGSSITSYAPKEEGGDYDFLDTSEETSAVYTYDSPAPGTVYVDVLNLTSTALRYGLAVEATWPSGVMGALALGETAVGTLSDPQTPRYHTYYVDVPLNALELVISMEADVDLDLAVKFGSEIASWADRSQAGDWDYIDEDASHSAAFTILNPRTGRWYIDVFTRYDTTGQYRLTVRPRRRGPATRWCRATTGSRVGNSRRSWTSRERTRATAIDASRS